MAGWCFGAPDQQSGLGLIARTPLQLARTRSISWHCREFTCLG